MNTKRHLAVILAVVILSIGFLSCEDKEDDTNTNPTTTFDVVKEVHSFIGKPYTEVISVLDKKGLVKSVKNYTNGGEYSYFNADSTKLYRVIFINDTITISSYQISDSSLDLNIKLSSNVNKYLLTFEKWKLSLDNLFDSESKFQSILVAGDPMVYDEYVERDLFLSAYNLEKPYINCILYSYFANNLCGRIDFKYPKTPENKLAISVMFIRTY